MKLLAINSGSSSLKHKLFDSFSGEEIVKGLCERNGLEHPVIKETKANRETIIRVVYSSSQFGRPSFSIVQKYTSFLDLTLLGLLIMVYYHWEVSSYDDRFYSLFVYHNGAKSYSAVTGSVTR